MNRKLSIKDLPIENHKILMRVDFNVPLDSQGHIIDDSRISAALPSINYVLDRGGALILMSHLGRPQGKIMPQMSLKVCAKRLTTLLGKEVLMADDCVGSKVEHMVKDLQPGQVLLLENLRFHSSEEHPEEDPDFVSQLAKFGDYYINDAFGAAHRSHASITSIASFFPGKAAAGFLMEKEILFLGETFLNPKRPFYTILGGAKISSKIGVIHSLLKKADTVFIGGGMAFTFFKAQGIEIGDSIYEENFLEKAKELMEEASNGNSRLKLPKDLIIADRIKNGAVQTVQSASGIPQGFRGVDIGPDTIEEYSREIKNAETVFWNGPLGIFEIREFAKGTEAIATMLGTLHATTIIGGGDSLAAIHASGLSEKMSHLSTGGGASLEYIEFGTLPGIEALSEK